MEPVRATHVPQQIGESNIPGAYSIESENKGLFYICPCGCGDLGFLTFCHAAEANRPSWEFDGNREAPTLAPSIRRLIGCKFHGHLRAGVWTFEGDSGVDREVSANNT